MSTSGTNRLADFAELVMNEVDGLPEVVMAISEAIDPTEFVIYFEDKNRPNVLIRFEEVTM